MASCKIQESKKKVSFEVDIKAVRFVQHLVSNPLLG